MKHQTLFALTLIAISCSRNANQNDEVDSNVDRIDQLNEGFDNADSDCLEYWEATGKKLLQKHINDSTEQVLLNDSLWFEVIGIHKTNGLRKSSYLKLYRPNGLLEQEGNATYAEHPIADFVKVGEWKFYDCNGKFTETKNYENGMEENK